MMGVGRVKANNGFRADNDVEDLSKIIMRPSEMLSQISVNKFIKLPVVICMIRENALQKILNSFYPARS